MSQITTHILDTSRGRPATGVAVFLYIKNDNSWNKVAEGVTNNDGRIAQLLTQDDKLPLGVYKLTFNTKAYFEPLGISSFYPYVDIVFEVSSTEHYHVPLLLNPFGYSTYRGS